MSEGVLKAIKDWCLGKFQAKGNYLTEVPNGYVTEAKLTESFSENMSGAKIAQDAEGKWGLITPGSDVIMPFDSGNGKAINSSTDIANAVPVFVASNSTVANGYEQINN